MHGTVSWEQVWALISVLTVVVGAAIVGTWRVVVYLSNARQEVEAKIEEERRSSDSKLEREIGTLEGRIGSLENFQAGTLVVLKHVDEFRVEVRGQYEALREQRRADIESIHRRLDAMHNAARLLTSISDEALGDHIRETTER